jgi:hypothetical protein
VLVVASGIESATTTVASKRVREQGPDVGIDVVLRFLVGRARDVTLEIGVIKRLTQELHNREDVVFTDDDAEWIIGTLGVVDGGAGEWDALDEVVEVLADARADMEFTRLFLDDGIEAVFGH